VLHRFLHRTLLRDAEIVLNGGQALAAAVLIAGGPVD